MSDFGRPMAWSVSDAVPEFVCKEASLSFFDWLSTIWHKAATYFRLLIIQIASQLRSHALAYLVCPADEIQIVTIEELLNDICSERIANSSVVVAPAAFNDIYMKFSQLNVPT